MKNIALLVITGLVFLCCNPATQHAEDAHTAKADTLISIVDEDVKDGVFIHITESYDDPHRVLMPLKMATIMANDKDVLIYMDIHAVELLVKDAKDLKYGDFESCQTYLKQLLKNNVGIYARPTCLKLAGFAAEDLMDGILTAQKDKFFNFTKGRIIALNY